MPQFEFEFNQQDKELVVNQEIATFSGTDYIRLTIYPTEAIDNIVTLANGEQAIFYSSLNEQPFEINISPFGAGLDEFKTLELGVGGADNDFRIYKNDNDIYIKPNEIFNQFQLPQGDYRIQIDFLNQLAPIEQWNPNAQSLYKFIVKQISTSRKEVRLKLLDINIASDDGFITDLTNQFNNNFLEESDGEFVENNPPFLQDGVTPNPNYKYQFKHVLNIGTGDHVPIMNYAFDAVTDGKDNQSLILKLYEPLSGDVQNLSLVTIEKEVITTQIQDIFYFSDVPDVFFGDGLSPQPQEDWIIPDGNDIQFENFDELSGSLNNITLDSLISQSQYDYPNINTDFNEFSNHTFFGLAEKKIINFKNKVEIIQGHYSEISNSLSVSSSIGGDSPFIIEKRKNLFKKIEEEFRNFTPYERFLYFDGQSESTSSAPGVGKNYANSIPLKSDVEDELTTLNNYEEIKQTDGFNIVYKNSNLSSASLGTGLNIGFTNRQYKVHEKPFFNYSGSVYLSFLIKGTDDLTFERKNHNAAMVGFLNNGFFLPESSHYTASLLEPSITGSEYRRFVFEASQSYFVPDTYTDDMAEIPITEFSDSSNFTILHDSVKTGSSPIKDSTGVYPTTVITQSGVPFKGSIMPAGDLFTIKFPKALNSQTQSFVTDVKVTLNNPTKAQPFSNVYHTGSSNWTDWYNDMLTKAENFDTDNIHSFENNLPLYIQNSSEYDDMKDFLKLQGEQYDLIRNHIDSMGTIHKRGYKKTNSPPDNTLPMLLSNMGWQAINPFSGSLTDSLGSYLSGITSIDDIKNNTWRKTLNNLLYIYKSKGTKNSVRALLNVYGYPPDVLKFQEFGGVTDSDTVDRNGDIPEFDEDFPQSNDDVDLDLNVRSGSLSFTTTTDRMYTYNFNANQDRILNFDWWMDDANANTIEFVYKHNRTTQTQTILESSGSGAETLWDLRLIPSSDGISSSFEFRLNNSQVADTAIGTRGVSMSLAYNNMSDGQLWNVMLQRMTSSISGTGIQEYRLHAALQDGVSISPHSHVTMSVSGGASGDSSTVEGRGFFANQNFQSSGSRHPLSSSNLFVGETFSGSLGEVRAWSTTLSKSKFRQHILNKFSTVGNTINSHKNDLIYHFKLNENYTTASVSASSQNLKIIDSAPTTTYSDYSITKAGEFFTGSLIYGRSAIERVILSLRDNTSQPNDDNIFINPNKGVLGNLSPDKPAIESLISPFGKKPKLKTSPKLELYRSPQTYVDNFILDNLGGFNLETLYGNPANYYSQSYDEFNTFREDFFDAHPITVDTNKFIRAHEDMFNHSVVEGVKSLVPARSTFSDLNSKVGVEIRPTVLEKQKYEHEHHIVETNPNTFTASVNSSPDLSTSEFIQPKSGSTNINITNTSTYELPKSSSINVNVTNTTIYDLPKSASISALPSLNNSEYVPPKNGTINYNSIANKSFVNIHNSWGTSSADTHFINFAAGTGSDGNYNVGHIDTRIVFHAISNNNEYYSSSRQDTSNFSDYSRFFNRLYLSDGTNKNVTYDSVNFGTGSGIVAGRMMGKTRYFRTGSDGNITLPRNHVSKFSNPWTDRMYEGAQNITNSGSSFLNVQHEDYSSASFYRVKVTGGENQIYVKGLNNPTKDETDDRIIY